MRKITLIAAVLMAAALPLRAQTLIDNYRFDTWEDETAWIDITGVDSALVPTPTGTAVVTSGGASQLTDIGFTFSFAGTDYTTFGTNLMGAVRLGARIVGTQSGSTILSTTSTLPKVDGLGVRGMVDSSCYIRCATVGTAGNRVLVVEYRLGIYQHDSTYVSWQTQLHEATGEVWLVYGPSEGISQLPTTQPGLAKSNTDMLFLDMANHMVQRLSSTPVPVNAAGVWPEEGRCYIFTPDNAACPAPPTVTALSSDPDSTVLSWPAVAGAGYHLSIAEAGLDAILNDTSIYIMGMLNGATTYIGTLQTMCADGSESYRMREFSFTTANGPVNSMPWTADFDNATAAANWNITLRADQISNWERRTLSGNGYMYSGAIDNPAYTADAWLISPPISLPAYDDVPLLWDYRSLQSTNRYDTPVIDVMVAVCDTTDAIDTSAAAWTKLMTLEGLVSNYKTYCLSLEGYSGHRVRVAFARHGFCFGTAYIDNVRIGTADTLARIYAPQHPMVDESTELRALYVGVDTIETPFNWNSSKYDNNEATMTARADSRVVDIVYATSGLDTITLQYGDRADTLVVLVKDCATASTYPWRDDFENGTDCWTLPSDNRWYLHRYPNCAYDGSCYMRSKTNPATAHNRLLSNTFVMPSAADITDLSLIFQARNTYNNTDAHLSVYFALDSNNAETLLIDTVIGWNTYRQITVPLSNLAGQTGHFVFEHWMSSTSITHDIYLDNVEVRFFNDTLPDSTLCDTIRLFPWQADFSNAFPCWQVINGTCQIHSNGYLSFTDWPTAVVSPLIYVPNDGNVVLEYDNAYSFFYGSTLVMVTTDMITYDTIEDHPFVSGTHPSTRLSLNAYAGQYIRVAFKATGEFLQYYLINVSIRYSFEPVVTVAADDGYFPGTPVTLTATLLEGDTTGLTYTWASTMTQHGDATLTSNGGPQATLVPEVGGLDTVTVWVTNAYGTDSAQIVVNTRPCDTVDALTWMEDFSNNFTCWWQPEGSQWMMSDDVNYTMAIAVNVWQPTDSWLISRAITLPMLPVGGNDELLLCWDASAQINDTHSYCVMVTTAADYRDLSSYDTLAAIDTVHPDITVGWSAMRLPLNAYAGQTVHLAFRYTTMGWEPNGQLPGVLEIDNIRIVDTTYPAPPPDTVWRMVTVHSADSTMGTVSGGGPCMDSTTVTIRADALQGYEFVAWNDGDTLNPRQVFVVSDTAFIALFREVEDSVGIAGVRAGEWRLFPNPASTSVTVEVVQPEVLTLLDVSGREVLRKRLSAGGTRVDISALPQGVYFVRLDGNALVKKLIVR